MNVYTKLHGRLAVFEIDTDDHSEAIQSVIDELRQTYGLRPGRINDHVLMPAVLAVIDGGAND